MLTLESKIAVFPNDKRSSLLPKSSFTRVKSFYITKYMHLTFMHTHITLRHNFFQCQTHQLITPYQKLNSFIRQPLIWLPSNIRLGLKYPVLIKGKYQLCSIKVL